MCKINVNWIAEIIIHVLFTIFTLNSVCHPAFQDIVMGIGHQKKIHFTPSYMKN